VRICCESGDPTWGFSFPHHDNRPGARLPLLAVHNQCRNAEAQKTMGQKLTFYIFPFSSFMKTVLWEYRLNFSGLIEAGPSLESARQLLMAELREHPERYISGLKPIQATDPMLIDIGKRLLGLKQ
jgi:hypothetical protein